MASHGIGLLGFGAHGLWRTGPDIRSRALRADVLARTSALSLVLEEEEYNHHPEVTLGNPMILPITVINAPTCVVADKLPGTI